MDWVKRYDQLRSTLNMIDAINKLVEEVKAADIDQATADKIEDKTLFIGDKWKEKYVEWYFNQPYFPTPLQQTEYIQNIIILQLKSQIAGYRVVTKGLIKRRDELIRINLQKINT